MSLPGESLTESIEQRDVLQAAGAETPRSRLKGRTQEERRTESERRMLEAALELVAEKGPHRVTLAEIGERAHYSRGLPAQHFGSKAALLAQLAKFISDKFTAHRAQYPSREGIFAIESVINAYFDRTDWVSTKAWLSMMTEGALSNYELREIVNNYNREAQNDFVRQIEISQIGNEGSEKVDAKALAVIIMAVFRGAMLQRFNDPSISLADTKLELIALVRSRLGMSGATQP